MKEIIIVGIVVVVFDFVLIVIEKLLKPKQNNLVEKYLSLLPGLNCNACGFGSCLGMAEAMCEDKMNYLKCKPLRGDKKKELEESINI